MINLLTNARPITLMISQSLVFILTYLSLHFFVSRHGPIRGASTLIKINSWFYSAASLTLFILMLFPSHDLLARRLYHASKFYEYVDILNVRAAGGSIDLHFGFHHLTTPYLTYSRVLEHSASWRPFAMLNAFHHTLMYAFFGGAAGLRSLLPWTGCLQLLVGIAVEGWLVRGRMRSEEDAGPNWLAGCLLTAYLVLFTRDLVLRSREESSKQKEV